MCPSIKVRRVSVLFIHSSTFTASISLNFLGKYYICGSQVLTRIRRSGLSKEILHSGQGDILLDEIQELDMHMWLWEVK